jgi:hypothetical protein
MAGHLRKCRLQLLNTKGDKDKRYKRNVRRIGQRER